MYSDPGYFQLYVLTLFLMYLSPFPVKTIDKTDILHNLSAFKQLQRAGKMTFLGKFQVHFNAKRKG